MNGEQNILWNTPIAWFAKSSGTTSDKSKFIPVSEESLQDGHYKGAKDLLTMYYHFNPDSDLLTGKGLVIGGSHTINQVNEDVHYGDLSAILLQNSPFWGHWIRTPELSIALLDEWENKIERLAMADHSRKCSTSISGVPTWALVLMRRILGDHGQKLYGGCLAFARALYSWRRLFTHLPGTVPKADRKGYPLSRHVQCQ